MIYRIATLDELRMAFFGAMQLIADAWDKKERLFVTAPAQESDPELKKIILSGAFIPGMVGRAELGGYEALASRKGVFKMTISTLPETEANEAWELAQELENGFLPFTVDPLLVKPSRAYDPDADENQDEPIEDKKPCPLFCDFPYTENIGLLPDGRNGITVTVPWWTWTQN